MLRWQNPTLIVRSQFLWTWSAGLSFLHAKHVIYLPLSSSSLSYTFAWIEVDSWGTLFFHTGENVLLLQCVGLCNCHNVQVIGRLSRVTNYYSQYIIYRQIEVSVSWNYNGNNHLTGFSVFKFWPPTPRGRLESHLITFLPSLS